IADCPADRQDSVRSIHPYYVSSYFHTSATSVTQNHAPHSHFNEEAMAENNAINDDYGENDELHCGLPLIHVNGERVTGL
ncbi:acyl-CoA synthetase, partial [Pseudomonas aeruginosa]